MTGSAIAHFGLPRQYSELREELLDITDRVLATGRVMDGEYTQRFESWLSWKNGRDYVVTCHSGTQALEIIARYYRALSKVHARQNPCVIIPALTYPATANAWVNAGWDIIFADVNRNGVIENILDIRQWDAICVVGLYGAALLDYTIGQYGYGYRLFVEDAAQHWLSDDCRRMGEAAAISFDPTKNLGSYGNGGAVVTSDPDLYKFAVNWVRNGKTSNHADIGSNSRMSEVDCAQMMVKTQYLHRWQKRRANIADYYCKQFVNLPIRCLISHDNFDRHCFQKFVIETENRDQLRSKLSSDGIDTRIHYERALHEMSAFEQYRSPGTITKASALSRRVLTLPLYPELTDSEVEFIASRVQVHAV